MSAEPGVSAETPSAPARVPGDPADPARCHVQDGPAISVSTAQMIACTAALSWMRRRRRGACPGKTPPPPQLGDPPRAARERDHDRCRFPGCESRRTEACRPHIQHWVNGGRTDLDNLISLCPWHPQCRPRPRLHHRRPAPRGGAPHLLLPRRHPSALLPAAAGSRRRHRGRPRCGHHPGHDIPPWYGERLDLNHAIWACFANARTEEEKRVDWEQASEPAFRPDTWGRDFNDTADYFRRYYDEHPAT